MAEAVASIPENEHYIDLVYNGANWILITEPVEFLTATGTWGCSCNNEAEPVNAEEPFDPLANARDIIEQFANAQKLLKQAKAASREYFGVKL